MNGLRLGIRPHRNNQPLDFGSILINIINMKNLPIDDCCTVDSSEACKTLGISRDTLYAYVSRGLVRTVADPRDARRSLYDHRDIAALLARKARGRSRRAVAASTIDWGEPILTSAITRIADGTFYYRGTNAIDFSRTASLEDSLLLLAKVRDNTAADPPAPNRVSGSVRPFNRILATVADLALADNADIRADQLLRIAALSAAGRQQDIAGRIHDFLAETWSNDPRAPDLIRRALVLCADHELNASTYATRVAASAGASLPACLLVGLATLSGTHHGGQTPKCREWMQKLGAAKRYSVAVPLGRKPPPGFGHALYPDGDPRAVELFRACGAPEKWLKVLERIQARNGVRPNLDFGLALLEEELDLPAGAGLGIFAVGRMSGWIAHIFEQRRTGKLIRPRAAFAPESA